MRPQMFGTRTRGCVALARTADDRIRESVACFQGAAPLGPNGSQGRLVPIPFGERAGSQRSAKMICPVASSMDSTMASDSTW